MQSIPYGRQEITPEDINEVVRVLKSDFLTQGPEVPRFEEAFAASVGAPEAIAVANGTAALHLGALALGIRPGQKVITTPITFAASANCVRYCGGEVLFAEIDPQTLLIDIESVKAIFDREPKGSVAGVIPVDFAGRCVDLERLHAITHPHGAWILEDACHALGGWFVDSKGARHLAGSGHWSDASIFSFHPVKHITTGEGGMITTRNPELAKKLRVLRTHGITRDPKDLHENHGGWYYEMQALGYNYRLTEIQAALGTSQLSRSGQMQARRNEVARRYINDLAALPLELPEVVSGHAFHLFVVQTQDAKTRLDLYDHLKKSAIYTQVHYIPVHTMPSYRELGWKAGDFPHAESYYSRALSLPMYPTLTSSDQARVVRAIGEFFR